MKRLIFNLSTLLVLLGFALNPAYAGKTSFVDGNAITKTPGTKVTSAFLNAVNSHRHDGGNYDGAGILDAAVDSGSVNTLVVTLPTPLTAHVPRMPIYVQVANTNTGACTINVSGIGALALQKSSSSGPVDLVAGDLQAGAIVIVAYDGTRYLLLTMPAGSDAATLQGQSASMLVPPGAIMAFGQAACPAGWTGAIGNTLLRTGQYAQLFAAWGTIYGAGDGSTTFGTPDLRGEFLRGVDGGRGVDPGRTIGSWQADMFKSHSHTGTYGGSVSATPDTGFYFVSSFGGATTGSTGGSETRPRNIAVNYCIKY